VFAVNTWSRWSNPGENEIDVFIDTDGDGDADMAVASIDLGVLLGTLWGVTGSAIIDLAASEITNLYFAAAGMNGSTVLLPVLASDLGLQRSGDRDFQYWSEAYEVFDDDGTIFQFDVMTTGDAVASPYASYDVWDPVLSNGLFKQLKAGAGRVLELSLDASRYDPVGGGHKGWLIATLEDANGEQQADLVPVGADVP
jgi:hypothetical protein